MKRENIILAGLCTPIISGLAGIRLVSVDIYFEVII
jgi:hypothetical protein